MSRPTARVLALLEVLQAGGTHTVGQLAERLGVDERTVRRYVVHLHDLDIPVLALRGRYGGYRLAPGYRLPPLMLTDEEALAVLLGLVAGHRSAAVPTSLDAAQSAVESAVAVTYTDRDGRRSARTLHPYGIVAHAGRWYVTGADSASGQVRLFRLDRVQSPTFLPGSFDVPRGFDPAASVLSTLAEAPHRHEVQLRVQGGIDEVRPLLPAAIATVEPLDRTPGAAADTAPPGSEPWVRVRIRAERLDWIPAVLAGLDRSYVIEHPEALRDLVQATAGRLLASTAVEAPGGRG